MVEIGVASAIIVGLVESIKQTGYVSSRWSALLAVAIGAVGFVLIGEGDMGQLVLAGILSGLSAAGLYSGTKATLNQ